MNHRRRFSLVISALCLATTLTFLWLIRPSKEALPSPNGTALSHVNDSNSRSLESKTAAGDKSAKAIASYSAAAPEAMIAFQNWIERFKSAAPAPKEALLEEGLRLAKERLTVMADLVQTDPQKAFANALSFSDRNSLPAQILEQTERRVTGVADLAVLASLGDTGVANVLPPVMRQVTLNGERYQGFTYGEGNRWVTKSGIPVYGLTVPNDAASVPFVTPLGRPRQLMALSDSPARLLDSDETQALAAERKSTQESDPICGVSNVSVTSKQQETVVEFAGEIHSFCGKVDADWWVNAHVAGLGLETPTVSLAGLDPAESSYTEGRKRMLLMRPVWSDYQGGMSTNTALTHWQSFSNYMYEMSYGKLQLAPLGQGSDITPPMTLPGLVADYNNEGLGTLYQGCKDAAQNDFGYNLAQYDFLYVCTDSKPAASYCGLAFVGGVGFHLANSCWDAAVSSHEFGHNLGLNHAHFWDTKSRSVIGDGQNVEYGDNNDPMGGGGSPNQYNSRYKNYLGWIKDSDIVDLNTNKSGTYRIYAFDLNQSSGVRGLKFARSSTQNYWINFRQRKTDKKALMNGVQLLWTGNGNEGSYLLDVRLKGDADNNAITIGRTFSDSASGFHFTPIGKANTFPESMDVVVTVGNPAGNLPPTGTISSAPEAPAVNQLVTLSMEALDPNGDTLAYSWDFGDGDFSVDNRSTTTHRYTTQGEYAAQCTVSDMKGGTFRASVIVRVGTPQTFRISGHVVDNKNRPLAGIKMFVDTSHYAYTDSDGHFAIVNVGAGSYTIDAIEPLQGNTSFAHPFFENPVTVGPENFATADFVGIPGSLINKTPIISQKATAWRYLDTGVDPGANWALAGFVDTGWKTGAAILGYGQGGETTVIGYGGNAANKYPAYYFRKSFVVKDPLVFTNFTMEVLRDDGVAVYLNGAEIFRDNLPAGPLTYTTRATDSVEPDSYLSKTIPNTQLLVGTNWIAAEVHQSTPDSSDLTFDLAFSGLSVSNVAGLSLVYLKQPVSQARYLQGDIIPLEAAVLTSSSVSGVSFYANGTKIAEKLTPPYTTDWPTPSSGDYQVSCVATLGLTQVTSPPVRIRISGPSTELPEQPLVNIGATWSYLASATAAAASWNQVSFDDSSWLKGAAKLGFGRGDEATAINGGPNLSRYPTIYFRHKLVIEDPAGLTNLVLQLQRDDGAAVYFNGVEVVRDNLPLGNLSYGTLATNASDNGLVLFSFNLSPDAQSLLTPGTNCIAVEVHQSSANSSDLGFALSLKASVRTSRPRGCYLISPEVGIALAPAKPITLKAECVAGESLGIKKVEFYIDGVKAGEDSAVPFQYIWANPTSGSHSIQAIAIDTSDVTIPSDPQVAEVLKGSAFQQWISFGDVWKYQDLGTDPGSQWTKPNYDDSAWKSGPARLGYGFPNKLNTILSSGTNASLKNITAYFRKRFDPTNVAADGLIRLQLGRNDGACVYLNGVEIFRDNLPTGKLSFNTLALTNVTDTGDAIPTEPSIPLLPSLLNPSNNVIAVELHQASPTSAEASFDLALSGHRTILDSERIYLTSPAQGTHFNLPASVAMSSEPGLSPGQTTTVEYFADGVKIGQSSTYPYRFTWLNPSAGSHSLTAVTSLDGATVTSFPIGITVGAAPAPISPVLDKLIPLGSNWRYWDDASQVPGGWNEATFSDAGWKQGKARLGFGLDGELTTLASGRKTYYFRNTFTATNVAAYNQLSFQLARDDGAVVYLNGTEVFRSNMPEGLITADTAASSVVNTPEETFLFETLIPLVGSGLRSGLNVVAVELHQQAIDSTDAAFDLQVLGIGTTERRVSLTSPSLTGYTSSGQPMLIEAAAEAGGPGQVSRVQFYADGQLLGEKTEKPWIYSWEEAPIGTHGLVARAWFSDNSSFDSSVLNATVSPLLIATQFVSPAAIWKFFDKGQNLGTSWRSNRFDDSLWLSGPARLGYGDDGEATTVSFGANSASKYITTYFRTGFEFPSNMVVTNLSFRYQRDDGIAVYLNGKEMFRNNLAANAAYNTVAAADVGGVDEQAWFSTNLVATNILIGTNIVAAEIHQSRVTSSDIGFALELVGTGYIKTAPVVRPTLDVTTTSEGTLEFSWPSSATGFQLWFSPSVEAPLVEWQRVQGEPSVAAQRFHLTVQPNSEKGFYRLRLP